MQNGSVPVTKGLDSLPVIFPSKLLTNEPSLLPLLMSLQIFLAWAPSLSTQSKWPDELPKTLLGQFSLVPII